MAELKSYILQAHLKAAQANALAKAFKRACKETTS